MVILRHNKGFTFIEVVIATAIFILFALGAYQAYNAVHAALVAARNKALAADLVNARFEVIKNMPYSNVGVVGGNPNGLVVGAETVVRDNISFDVTTTISYVDDPFDGILGGGDAFPNDYKLIEISINCASCKYFDPVIITGRVAPKNLESA